VLRNGPMATPQDTIRFTLGGSHVGEFMGVPPTGTEIELPGITILRFDGDKVIERSSQADNARPARPARRRPGPRLVKGARPL